jgi:hypothetical protein
MMPLRTMNKRLDCAWDAPQKQYVNGPPNPPQSRLPRCRSEHPYWGQQQQWRRWQWQQRVGAFSDGVGFRAVECAHEIVLFVIAA